MNSTRLDVYIGSQTMYSCADNGAFDSEVSKELEDFANGDEGIFAILDENGVNNFLSVLKNGNCTGRDIDKFIKAVEENYRDGFMMRG